MGEPSEFQLGQTSNKSDSQSAVSNQSICICVSDYNDHFTNWYIIDNSSKKLNHKDLRYISSYGGILPIYTPENDESPVNTNNKNKEDGDDLRQISDIYKSLLARSLHPCHPSKRPYRMGTTFAYSGSMVYCIGGDGDENTNRRYYSTFEFNYIRQVYMADLCGNSKNFEELPCMLACRSGSDALILSEKLYVFGGNCADSEPWAECYDLKQGINGNWKELREPLVRLSIQSKVYALPYGNGEILVGPLRGFKKEEEVVMVYNIEQDSWRCFQSPTDSPPPVHSSVKPIIVDNTLYWLTQYMSAYDLKRHRHYVGHFYESVLAHLDYETPIPPLIHLGGEEFCSFTVDQSHYRNKCDRTPSIVMCTRFRMVKCKNGHLDISVLARHTRSFVVGHPLSMLGLKATMLDIDSTKKRDNDKSVAVQVGKRSVLRSKPQKRWVKRVHNIDQAEQ